MRICSRLLMLLILAACLTGCGLDDDDQEAGYEQALYMAYATSQNAETMHTITTSDLMRVTGAITQLMQDYANDYGFDETTINLSSPPDGWGTVPSGMRGTITFDLTTLYVTMDLSLSGCDIDGSRSYSGTFVAEGYLDSAYAVSNITITASSLDIEYSIDGFETVYFTDFILGVNKTGAYPAYTYDGALTYGSDDYAYSAFRVQQTSGTDKTASGKIVINGSYYGIAATVTTDSSGTWTGGTVTITDQDSGGTIQETVTVTLSGTSAAFQITDGESWDVPDWYSEELTP